MEELKPCPFCGGEAHVLKDGLPYVVIECERCFCRTNCNVTEKEAIAAWNTRSYRTCSMEQMPCGSWKCSSCGTVEGHNVEPLDRYPYAYCPNCGAKVVR